MASLSGHFYLQAVEEHYVEFNYTIKFKLKDNLE